MKKNLLPIIASIFSWALLVGPAPAAIVAQWTFEGDVLTPALGTGSAINIGSTSSSFVIGNNGGRGWSTAAYPTQGTASGTAGVRFNVPTTGFAGITIQFDHRASGTASRWAQLEYSLDGGNAWVVFGNNAGGLSPHDVFHSFSFDLSAITLIDNHPDFTFRIVSIFSPLAFDQNADLDDYAANAAYMRASSEASYTAGAGTGAGNYGTSGTWRFDNVTVSAAVPEPSALLLGGLGLLASVGRRR